MADRGTDAPAPAPDPRVSALVASFERIGRESMQGLPFYNAALAVEAVGFDRFGAERLGVLITPWFMNLMLLPDEHVPYAEAGNGGKRAVELPSGAAAFLCGGTPDFGMFHARALVSPMGAFASQDRARAYARGALARALAPPAAEQDAPSRAAPSGVDGGEASVSRRTLFRFAGRPLNSRS